VANALAYYEKSTITALKSFTEQATCANALKLFSFITDASKNEKILTFLSSFSG
jgi:hypothetical protein